MDLDYPAGAEEFRATLSRLIADNVPAGFTGVGALDRAEYEEFAKRWRGVLAEHNLLAVSWPTEYGGAGLSLVEQVVVAEEFARAGVPMGTESDMFGIQLLGNTMLVWGTEEQKRHFLPRIVGGQDAWCQGFSEPNAGSDLAGLRTRAVRDGDRWVINGSKIWTSTAQMADWIFILCRTDTDAPKHKGITMLLAPMDQPGIEIRPITNMIGESFFNEVFFTDARTEAVNVLGPVNGGWKVAMTMLGFERGTSATTDAIRFESDLDRLVRLARDRGLSDDPYIREQLAWCHGRVEIMRSRGHQALTRFLRGEFPGPEAAINKIVWSEFFQRETELALEMLGADALTPSGPGLNGVVAMSEPGTPNSTRSWVESAMNARASTIYAGSSQVQRNIIGEQLLGLPKEPRP